jgi:pyridoxine 5'-phosphate synthase PdxJ
MEVDARHRGRGSLLRVALDAELAGLVVSPTLHGAIALARAVARAGDRQLDIGHCIIARAIFTGLEAAVRDMKALMLSARR